MPFGSGGAQYKLSAKVSGDGFSGLESKITGVQSSMGKLKKAAGGLSLGLAALSAGGIAKSVQAAADFQGAMQESLAIMGDVSDAMREDMSQAARDVAKQTTFSANQAAESYFFLASAGLDAKESMEALPQVAEFAQAGMFDMEKATDLLTDSASALGVEMDNLSQLGDKFVKANTLANTSVEQIAQAMTNKAAPAMKNLGVQTDQGIAALSVFADQGLKGRRAGTILARTLQGLGKQAQENSKAFEELGISVFDNEGNMRDLDAIVQDMEQSLGGMSAEQRQAALSQLGFNRRAKQGVDLLLGNSQQLSEYESELKNAGGTASEVADKQLQSFNSQLKLLKSQVVDIGITIGKAFLPILTDIVKRIQPVLKGFSAWVGALDRTKLAAGSAATTIGLLGAGLAAFIGGPLTLAIGAVAGLAAAFATDFMGIRSAVMPVINVLANQFLPTIRQLRDLGTMILQDLLSTFRIAMAGSGQSARDLVTTIRTELIAGIRQAFSFIRGILQQAKRWWLTHREEVLAALFNLIQTVRQIVREGLTFFRQVVQKQLTKVLQFWREHKGQILGTLRNLFVLVKEIVTQALTLVLNLWRTHGQKLLKTVRSNINFITDLFRTFAGMVLDIVGPLVKRIRLFWKENGAQIRFIVENLVGAVIVLFRGLVNALRGILEPALGAIQFLWKHLGDEIVTVIEFTFDLIMSVVSFTLDLIVTTIKNFKAVVRGDWEALWNNTAAFLERTFNGIINFIVKWESRWLDWLGGLIGDTIQWFKDLARDLIGGSIIPNMFNDILSAAGTFASDLLGWLSGMVSDFISDVQSFAGDVVSKFKSMGSDAVSALEDGLSGLYQAGKSAVQSVVNGINSKIDDVKSAASGVASAIADRLPGSDARYGPLSDLTRQSRAIADVVSGEMTANVDMVEDASVDLAQAARPAAPAASSGGRGGGDTIVQIDTIHVDAEDGEDFAGQFAREMRSRGFND